MELRVVPQFQIWKALGYPLQHQVSRIDSIDIDLAYKSEE